ncbi:sulfur carrier protein ThiS [Rothia sp. P7208]|uniref:sulfur carrier protein ThiS n=1 Tax=Rothia sp. P7208 TaxID=3402660 RepID=UPI003AC5E086
MNITLTINGAEHTYTTPQTIKKLVEDTINTALNNQGNTQDGTPLGIAVALNDTVLPRNQWAHTTANHHDRLEIITAVQGG